MRRVARYWVGIDLHRVVYQVCVLDRDGDPVELRRFRLPLGDSGEELFEFLRPYRRTGRLAVEALGLNRWFVNECLRRGFEVVVADPFKLDLKKAGKKTDRTDAVEIARRLYLGDIDRHARTYYPTDEEYGVRKLLRTRHRLVRMRQQVINQIRSIFNAYRVPSRGGQLYTRPNLQWLRECRLGIADLDEVLAVLVDSLAAVQRSILQLDRRIQMRAEEPAVAKLTELPSVGVQTALTLHYELVDLARFTSSRAVANYAGLVPRVIQSADTAHHGRLTPRGKRHLRWVASQWAVRLLATDSRVQRWSVPRLRRMTKNKVRIALARRLLVGMYVATRRGEAFDLDRCLKR